MLGKGVVYLFKKGWGLWYLWLPVFGIPDVYETLFDIFDAANPYPQLTTGLLPMVVLAIGLSYRYNHRCTRIYGSLYGSMAWSAYTAYAFFWPWLSYYGLFEPWPYYQPWTVILSTLTFVASIASYCVVGPAWLQNMVRKRCILWLGTDPLQRQSWSGETNWMLSKEEALDKDVYGGPTGLIIGTYADTDLNKKAISAVAAKLGLGDEAYRPGEDWESRKGKPNVRLMRSRQFIRQPLGKGTVLLEAPTRAGKGRSFILTNLLDSSTALDGSPSPMFVFDLKGENIAMTWRRRVAMGMRPIGLDPYDILHGGKYTDDAWKYYLDRRWHYNPFDFVRGVKRDDNGNVIYNSALLTPPANDNEFSLSGSSSARWDVAVCLPEMQDDLESMAESNYQSPPEKVEHFTQLGRTEFIGAAAWVLTSKWLEAEVGMRDEDRHIGTVFDLFLRRSKDDLQRVMEFMALDCNANVGNGLPRMAAITFLNTLKSDGEHSGLMTSTQNGLKWIDTPMREMMSKSGAIVFARDEDGRTVLDDEGKPVPEMVTISKALQKTDDQGKLLWTASGDADVDDYETEIEIPRFEPFCMTELADGKTDIFLVLSSDAMNRKGGWLRMTLTAVAQTAQRQSLKKNLIFMLDEMAQLGYMPILEKLATIGAGLGLQMCFVFQDSAQASKAYGKEGYESILGNAIMRISMASANYSHAKAISEALGKITIIKQQDSMSGQAGGGVNRSASLQEKQVDILTPQQIQTLSEMQGIAIPRGLRAFIYDKANYDQVAAYHENGDPKHPVYPSPNPLDNNRCQVWENWMLKNKKAA